MRTTMISTLALLLAACGSGERAPTVSDGSSPGAFKRTMAEAKSELGPTDRIKFEAAVAEFRAAEFARADTRQDYERNVRAGLDGLTAPRVVTELDKNVRKLKEDAADAAFDIKRELKGATKQN